MSPISDHVAKLKGERGVSHFLSDREATLKLLKEVSPISDHVATFKVLKRCQPFQTMLQGYSFQKRCQPLSFRRCCNAADSDPTHSTMGGFFSRQKMKILFCESTIPLKLMHIKSLKLLVRKESGGAWLCPLYKPCPICLFQIVLKCYRGSKPCCKIYAPRSHCVETSCSSSFFSRKSNERSQRVS